MKRDIAIDVQGLSKKYFIGTIKKYKKKQIGLRDNLLLPFRMLRNIGETSFFNKNDDFIWALKDINFNIHHGEKVGIIGKNGAGKSTLLKILSRLVYPTEGKATIRGRVTSLLEVGTGFNNNFTGRENVYMNATLYGLERAEIDSIFDDIVEFSGVGKFLDTKIKYYSSGMRMRLAFSVAAHLDPDILLLDEVLAVGDIAFQQKCLDRVEGLASGGRTIVFVSHSMGAIMKFCDRVIWIDEGRIRYDGEAAEAVKLYENGQSSHQEVGLEMRNDRTGTGLVKYTKVSILDENMNPCETVRTGQRINIALDYKAEEHFPEPPRDVKGCIIIEDSKQNRLFGLPSEILTVDLTNIGPSGRFICRVDRLPLVPGIYDITISLLIDRQLVDKVTHAHKLIIVEDDYYGTGLLPKPTMGSVCVDFNWSHESRN